MTTPHKRFRLTKEDLGALERIMSELRTERPWGRVTATDAIRAALAARDPKTRPAK